MKLACTRRVVAAAAFGIAIPSSASAADAAAAQVTRELLKQAREQLEPCAGQIADGNWDGVRNVVKTQPLASAKNLITKYIGEAGEAAEDLVVPRQDVVQALQLLDMAVYNNNFISEQNSQGAKGRGVKVDREMPLQHLSETKNALDEILAFKP